MSELLKTLQGAATGEQIAELLADVFFNVGVEIPSKADGWAHHSVRLLGAIRYHKERSRCVDVYQDSHNNMMRA